MLYEKGRELVQLSVQHWISQEVFSFGWFLMVGVLIVVYIIWFILLDKSRATQLLLIGSLAAVAFTLSNMVVIWFFGMVDYKIRLLPLRPALFVNSVTLSPILIMLVQQYTSTWKKYIIWSAVGFAFLSFVLFPLYTKAGIIELHNGWNWFYHFLVMFGVSLIVRTAYRWIAGTEERLQGRNAKGPA